MDGKVVGERVMRRAAGGVSVLLLGSCFGLVSCMSGNAGTIAPTAGEFASESRPADSAPEIFEHAAADPAAFDDSSVVLLPAGPGQVGVELAAIRDGDQIFIRGPIDDGDFTVTRLEQPARVVVDLRGAAGTASHTPSRTFDGLGAATFDRMRIGAHPDKTRMVLDLNADLSSITWDARPTAEGVLLTLRSSGAAGHELVTNAAEPFTSPVIGTGPAAETEIARPGEVPAVDRGSELAAAEPMTPRLTALRFGESADGAGALFVDMQSAGVFSLKRTAPSEYVLVLEDAALAPNSVRTVLSPTPHSIIRSARPVVEGRDVLVRIFTAPEATLSAKPRAGGVSVTASSPLAGDVYAADPRAQLAEGEAVPAETADTATAAAGAAEPPTLDEEDADIAALLDESPRYTGRLISLDLQDTDIDNALRIIAEVSNLNIIASEDVAGKVTLRLIDVPWDQALDVILKTNGLDKVQEGNVVRVAPVEKLRAEREALKQAQQAEEDLEPLTVKYLRVSYARAAELKPLVETVLSERGTVTYDERTNQLIIKDIRKGLRNVVELVSKLDLRTPQVLLETQIVEATRSFTRNLGSELGFTFVQSPETGNSTGYNFPNSVLAGGSATGSDLPGAVSSYAADTTSALSILLGSADGTKSLSARLSGAETEGIARIISRPAIATTNNKQAEIKSVRKIRVRTPSGGTSVAVGGSAAGGSAVATEVIEVGIILQVTPQASPDYYVLLDVDAKSSSIDEGRSTDGIPEEIERSTTSTILVSSGQTFVMGGIYKIDERDNNRGTPWLKDVPVLGHLFRTIGDTEADEELLFFITPRIVEGSFDDAAMRAAM